MSAIDAKFGHVNVTGRDWRRLAAFYTDVFGCEFVPPERDIRSADLDAATGLHDAHLTGAHLRLPGHGDAGPTLEIFEYESSTATPAPRSTDRAGVTSHSRSRTSRPRSTQSLPRAAAGSARSSRCRPRTVGTSRGSTRRTPTGTSSSCRPGLTKVADGPRRESRGIPAG